MAWEQAYKKEDARPSEQNPYWDDQRIIRQAEENLEKRYPL